MNGELLWFNEVKHLGAIKTDDGQRLQVHRSAFAPGHAPVGRCAGMKVAFTVGQADGELQALDVEVMPMVAPRRARRRYRSGAS